MGAGSSRGVHKTSKGAWPKPERRAVRALSGKRRAPGRLALLVALLCLFLPWPFEARGQAFRPRAASDPSQDLSIGEGQQTGRSTGTFRYVEELLRPAWEDVVVSLNGSSSDTLQTALDRLYESKLDSGFPSSPRFAALLLRQAYRLLESGQVQTARLLAESALNLAPDFAPAHGLLAHMASRQPEGAFLDSVRHTLACWKAQALDFHWQYRTAGKLLLLLFAGLYGLLLFQGPYVLLRYGPLAVHRLRERFGLGRAGALLFSIVGLLACLGALVLVGPLWTVVGLNFCLGPYARRWEKILFLFLLSVWIFAPWIALAAVRHLSLPPDGAAALYALEKGEWDQAADSALNRALASQPESVDILWAAALVEKRTGRYREAEAHLRRALDLDRRNGALWNNLGNLLAFAGRTEEAKEAYERSIQCERGLAAPHYNLSQILRREFSFLKGAAAFQEARRLDPDRTEYFVYIHSPHPNRFYMDVPPGFFRTWATALAASTDARQSAEQLWSLARARTSTRLTGILVAISALAYALLVLSGKIPAGAYRCQTCGSIACSYCQPIPSARQTCNPCHQVLYRRSEIPKEHRQKQLRRMARHGRGRLRVTLATNLLFPALGQAVLHNRPAEAVRFCVFVLAVVLVAGWKALLPTPSWPWQAGQVLDAGSLLPWFVLLAGYGALQFRFLRRAAPGR